MADNGFTVNLDGINGLKNVMAELPENIRRRAVRGALREAAKPILQAAKQNAPLLVVPTRYRNTGTVKRALTIRFSKFSKRAGDEGVFINPKPLVKQSAAGKTQKRQPGKKGFASAKNPNDPYYWYFLEFGTRKMAKKPFLGPAADSHGQEAVKRFFDSVIPKIEKLNRTK